MRPQMYPDERIFESISIVLAKQGYEALTLQNIAGQAKLSPAILSKRFGSKKRMLLAYYDYLIALTERSFAGLSERSLPPVEALAEIFTQWYDFIKKPQEFANLTMLYLNLDIEPDFIEKSKKRLRVVDAEVQRILEEGIRRGEIQCVEVAEMSQVLQAAATGACLLWCRDEEGTDPRQRIELCLKMILENGRKLK